MSGRGPTQDDIDNYHRLCVEFVQIHASVVSNCFKENNFDYDKTRCILRGMILNDEDYLPGLQETGAFGEDDLRAYDEPDSAASVTSEPVSLPLAYLTQDYILNGAIHDDPDSQETRPLMPNELEAIEHARSDDPEAQLFAPFGYVCPNWLRAGFCDDKECKMLHSLYGVACPDGKTCTNQDCCSLVHETILQQCTSVREKFGMELRRPDEPELKYNRAAWEAFKATKCPSLDELRKAFPGEVFPDDFADVDLCSWPWPEEETPEDKAVAEQIERDDKASGEKKLLGSMVIPPDDQEPPREVKFYGLSSLWTVKYPLVEKFRACNNEMEIHGRMRMFHIGAALKCKGSEAAEHLRLARIHYNRERYLGRDSDSFLLHMANDRCAVFDDTKECVLYLYGASVCEAREILNQLINGSHPQIRCFVFSMLTREQYFHFVTLDDVRKFCDAKKIPVVSHDGLLEFVLPEKKGK